MDTDKGVYAIHSGSITKTSFRWNAKVVKISYRQRLKIFRDKVQRNCTTQQRRATFPCSLYVYILAIKGRSTQRRRSPDGIRQEQQLHYLICNLLTFILKKQISLDHAARVPGG